MVQAIPALQACGLAIAGPLYARHGPRYPRHPRIPIIDIPVTDAAGQSSRMNVYAQGAALPTVILETSATAPTNSSAVTADATSRLPPMTVVSDSHGARHTLSPVRETITKTSTETLTYTIGNPPSARVTTTVYEYPYYEYYITVFASHSPTV